MRPRQRAERARDQEVNSFGAGEYSKTMKQNGHVLGCTVSSRATSGEDLVDLLVEVGIVAKGGRCTLGEDQAQTLGRGCISRGLS